jgi:hypothetical protein
MLARFGQGLEIRELMGTSWLTGKDAQTIREHDHIARTQGAVGQKRWNGVGNFARRFGLDGLLDFQLLDDNGLRT